MLPIKRLDRKFILITSDFSGFGFSLHEKDEVIIAYNPKEVKPDDIPLKEHGKGLVRCFPLVDLLKKRDKFKDWYWVWDCNHNPKVNDLLRKEGFKVWGGHSLTYRMENEREFTLNLAEKYGLHSPEHHEFKSVDEGIKFLEANPDKAYVFKANGSDDCALTKVPAPGIEPQAANLEMQAMIKALGVDDFILQEKVDGVEVNVEYFVVNGKPVSANANLEGKRLCNGDLGQNTGCMFDVCWVIPMDCKLAKMTTGKFLPFAQKLNYTGFVDANCIIGKDEVYFLETCWRIGYNAHCNFFQTLSKKTFLQTCADMVDGIIDTDYYSGFGASLTIRQPKPTANLPIYFPESLMPSLHFFDLKKEGDLYLTVGEAQEIVIVTAHDWTIQRAFEKCLVNAEKFRLDDKIMRTDVARCDFPSSPIKRYESLQAMNLF